ncbi:MAG: universal stress protein [Haloarcula sp.]
MTVLAAVDGTETPDRVVSVASDMATAHGEELVVLHVIPEETYEQRSESTDDYFRDDAIHDAKQIGRRVVRETLGSENDATYIGRIGTPGAGILDAIESEEPSYVVLGSRKRTPVGKALLGSTTQSVLLHTDVPVVAIPDES